MASVNSVTLIGNLGQDPELRRTQNDTPVCSFSMATKEWVKDGDDRTEWHNIVVWSKQAENCAQYLKKGSLAYIQGRIQTRSWEDSDGAKRYKTEVVAQHVQFLTPKTKYENEPITQPGGAF